MAWTERQGPGVYIAAAMVLTVFFAAPGVAAIPDRDPPPFQGYQLPFTVFSPAVAAPAPPLHTLKGGVTTLKRFSGRVVLLNLWATWCPACRHEMPALDRLQAEIGGDRFTVVSLSIDGGGVKKVRAFLDSLGIGDLPVYLDPLARVLGALGVGKALPVSFIIDHRGRVRGYMKGAADWSSPDARNLIRYYTDRIPP